MANAVWPLTLPQDVLVQGYDESFGTGKLRTQMDAGPAKQRRRTTAKVRPFKLTVPLTRAQVQILQDFHDTTLADGTLPFDMTHPRTLATVTFRFVGEPHPVPESGQSWLCDLDLEILP